MTEATAVTFEAGYQQLKDIVDRLDADDVSVHESCELFARGKGLEQALRGYLTDQKGKLDEIEAGEHLPAFHIVAPDAPPAAERTQTDAGNFVPRTVERRPEAADDDIPF